MPLLVAGVSVLLENLYLQLKLLAKGKIYSEIVPVQRVSTPATKTNSEPNSQSVKPSKLKR